jgi:sugar phosphate isomerase/epimerase
MLQSDDVNLLASFVAAIVLCLAPKALPAADPGDAAAAPAAGAEAATPSARKPAIPPLFAFDNGTGRGKLPFDAQAAMLKTLGYDGIGYTGTRRIPEMLAALDARGLTMFSTYVGANVDPGKPPYDPGLPEAIRQLRGRPTVIWLFVRGGEPSSDARDAEAVKILREVADMAAASDLRVALYPHAGFYVARVEDALRLVAKARRKNLGVSFNLCHFLKLDAERNIETTLAKAMPHLFLVSINGADRGATSRMGWDRLIQTLDRGDFDNRRFLATLLRLGYRGPVGLQCYAIPGPPRANLARSISAWKETTSGLAVPKPDAPR